MGENSVRAASGSNSQQGIAMRRLVRRILLALIAVLYLVSIPWYRPTGSPVEILLGLPDWVTVALACYVAIAVLNSLAWLLTEVPDGTPPGPGPEA